MSFFKKEDFDSRTGFQKYWGSTHNHVLSTKEAAELANTVLRERGIEIVALQDPPKKECAHALLRLPDGVTSGMIINSAAKPIKIEDPSVYYCWKCGEKLKTPKWELA